MCTFKQYLLGVLLLAAGLSCAQDKGEESKFGVTELLAINRTDGKVRWGYYVGRAESRAVELRDGNAQVVIRSSDACLEFDCVNAFDMEDGVAVDLAEPDETVEPENPCSELTLEKVDTAYLIEGVCVGLGTDDPSSVFAYDVDSQEELWSKQFDTDSIGILSDTIIAISCAASGDICSASRIMHEDGSIEWTYSIPEPLSFADADAQRVYLLGAIPRAVNRTTGELMWKGSSPADGAVLLGDVLFTWRQHYPSLCDVPEFDHEDCTIPKI